jgi:hypothetical protein
MATTQVRNKHANFQLFHLCINFSFLFALLFILRITPLSMMFCALDLQIFFAHVGLHKCCCNRQHQCQLTPRATSLLSTSAAADIMGFVYNIMQKFLKFDDDDEEGGAVAGNAADALLRWCQFQTKGYNGVDITNLKKSWADGLALCALVHKFAPDALDFDKLKPGSLT